MDDLRQVASEPIAIVPEVKRLRLSRMSEQRFDENDSIDKLVQLGKANVEDIQFVEEHEAVVDHFCAPPGACSKPR
jgi:hypothetical protein